MKKVAVLGNAGGGKSALAQRLAELTGLPLYVVDMMQFKPGGAKVPHDEFLQAHADIPVTNGSSTVLAIWRLPGSGSPPPIR
jgi:adenylate kinase family enzyme